MSNISQQQQQDDPELIGGNDGTTPTNDLYQNSDGADDTEDPDNPVKRGQSRIASLPQYRGPTVKPVSRKIRAASGAPSGRITHLTPGAKRIQP